jgi:hypothetical protein
MRSYCYIRGWLLIPSILDVVVAEFNESCDKVLVDQHSVLDRVRSGEAGLGAVSVLVIRIVIWSRMPISFIWPRPLIMSCRHH